MALRKSVFIFLTVCAVGFGSSITYWVQATTNSFKQSLENISVTKHIRVCFSFKKKSMDSQNSKATQKFKKIVSERQRALSVLARRGSENAYV